MGLLPSLPSLLEEWRQLTVAESQALRARDWSRVRACQAAKEQLRSRLQPPLEPPPAGARDRLDRLVAELLELEAANRAWLATQMATLRARLQELDSSARTLKCVRHSYGRTEGCQWQSYS